MTPERATKILKTLNERFALTELPGLSKLVGSEVVAFNASAMLIGVGQENKEYVEDEDLRDWLESGIMLMDTRIAEHFKLEFVPGSRYALSRITGFAEGKDFMDWVGKTLGTYLGVTDEDAHLPHIPSREKGGQPEYYLDLGRLRAIAAGQYQVKPGDEKDRGDVASR